MGLFGNIFKSKKQPKLGMDIPPVPPPGMQDKSLNLDEINDIPIPEPDSSGQDFPEQQQQHNTPSQDYSAPDFQDIPEPPQFPSFEDGTDQQQDTEEELPFMHEEPIEPPKAEDFMPKGQVRPLVQPGSRQAPQQLQHVQIASQKKQLKHYKPIMDIPDVEQPLFVKADNFARLFNEMSDARSQLKHLDDISTNIDDINNNKDRTLASWRTVLEDAERKLLMIDNLLFKGD